MNHEIICRKHFKMYNISITIYEKKYWASGIWSHDTFIVSQIPYCIVFMISPYFYEFLLLYFYPKSTVIALARICLKFGLWIVPKSLYIKGLVLCLW